GIVAGAVRAAEDDRDLGHDAIGDDIDQLGAGTNDSGLFRIAADHEAVHILKEEQGKPGLVAVHDKAGGLVGAIHIDDAAVLNRPGGRLAALLLISDHANRDAAEP